MVTMHIRQRAKDQTCVFLSGRMGACTSDACNQGRGECPTPLECVAPDDALRPAAGILLGVIAALAVWAAFAVVWVTL
jgi:hypothetical protein